MKPRDFLVVGGCDNIFNFYHETTRLSRGGCVGQPSLVFQGDHKIFSRWMCMPTFYFSPRDHEIFSWWVGVTIFLIFTMRPRDFLVVGVCDNILNINCETMRFSCGGCVGQPLLVFPRDGLYKLQCIIIL